MNAGAQKTLAHSWLLLIHQLPAKPAYLRVKIWRRLQSMGAIAVKNAVHALPMNEETQEDFEWLLREILPLARITHSIYASARGVSSLTWP